ncbi:MAG: hypothetical protein ABIH41_03700, partial [Nanoarchaeota archaeon]
MRCVAQEHVMGCGVACVAAAARIRYVDALRRFNVKNAGTKGYTLAEMRGALAQLGLRYAFARMGPERKALMRKVGTIVFIKPSDRYPAGHYLLRVASGWMDPWINLPSVAPARA